MPRSKHTRSQPVPPQPGWAVYLRTSTDENQKPEMSRARQLFTIETNVLERSDIGVYDTYIDVLTGKTPNRAGYQKLLADARAGKFSHVIVERADRFGRNDTEALRAIDELYEFGVAVRFANSPDLDPMDPDDRVLVALSFTLARRESSLLGIRVKGGQRAKRQSGGWCGQAPDGYRNVEERTTADVRKQFGKFTRRIEIEPERAQLWREAWALLLEDRYTLEEIAEILHGRGYRRMRGGPFVTVLKNGKRRPNISTLSNAFRNWAYAGWVVSKANDIPPKTIRGIWEPIISTEDFERGLAILERRIDNRSYKRRHDYLLTGMIVYQDTQGKLTRLTGSTSNAGRLRGGTPYYRVSAPGGVAFLCAEIDARVAEELHRIQIDPELLPLIRASYTHELAEQMGIIPPDEKIKLQNKLKEIDAEEVRLARMMASGKISEATWDELWREWQEQREQIRRMIESLEMQQMHHIDNLESALQIIAVIGKLYNGLQRKDQKEVLRQIADRVVVNENGSVKLVLRSLFAYLSELSGEVGAIQAQQQKKSGKTKRGEPTHVCAPTPSAEQSSTRRHFLWGTWIRTRTNGSKGRGSAVELSPNDC